jgi:hypothetical protein
MTDGIVFANQPFSLNLMMLIVAWTASPVGRLTINLNTAADNGCLAAAPDFGKTLAPPVVRAGA